MKLWSQPHYYTVGSVSLTKLYHQRPGQHVAQEVEGVGLGWL